MPNDEEQPKAAPVPRIVPDTFPGHVVLFYDPSVDGYWHQGGLDITGYLVVPSAENPFMVRMHPMVLDPETKEGMTLLEYINRHPEIDLSKVLITTRTRNRDGSWS